MQTILTQITYVNFYNMGIVNPIRKEWQTTNITIDKNIINSQQKLGMIAAYCRGYVTNITAPSNSILYIGAPSKSILYVGTAPSNSIV